MPERRPLFIILLIVFVNLLGFGIIIPLLPFYADHVGASPLAVGLLFASYSLCQLLAAPLLGSLSDRYGRRPILLYSLAGTVLSFTLLAVANSLWLLFVARIIDGLSGGNISTARAYISDITPPEGRARAYGLIGAAFGLGFIFGPALGGLLGHISYAAPAWAAAGLALVAWLLTLFWLPETTRHVTSAGGSPWRAIPELVARPVVGRLLIVNLLYWVAFAVYETTFALFAKARFDWGMTQVGYVLAGVGIIGAVVQGGLVHRVVHRIGEKQTLVTGLVLAAIGLAAASFVHSVPLFIATLVPASVGAGLSSPALITLLSQAAQAGEQGRVQGVASAFESLGRIFGPVWGNGMLGWVGEGAAYLSAAILLAVVAWLAAGLAVSRHLGEPRAAHM
jgi:MFS transporter, DHA1 family, tetracycline resistance protein